MKYHYPARNCIDPEILLNVPSWLMHLVLKEVSHG
jgi:hypothetical protein